MPTHPQGQGKTGTDISFIQAEKYINTTHLYDRLAYVLWNAGGPSLLILLNVAALLGE